MSTKEANSSNGKGDIMVTLDNNHEPEKRDSELDATRKCQNDNMLISENRTGLECSVS